jgi:photosystem II stability/assembly factor-like uncharacterized protein
MSAERLMPNAWGFFRSASALSISYCFPCNVSGFLQVKEQSLCMKKILTLAPLLFVLLSCNKKEPTQQGEPHSALCLDTTTIWHSLSGIQSIFFISEKDGFAGAATGDIYKTTDSAKTWIKMSSNTDLPVYGIYFTDLQTGYAVGGSSSCSGTGCVPAGGIILKTTNGGQNWSKIFSTPKWLAISSVYFVNKTLGFCVGGNTVFKTENAGQSWSEYEVQNLGGVMNQVKFSDANKGYITSSSGNILTTNNGGQSWQVTSQSKPQSLLSVAAADNNTVYISGSGKILKSTNGGSYFAELPNSPTDIYSLYFQDSKTGYAFGRGDYSGGDFGYLYGSIYCTNDGGNTWSGMRNLKPGAIFTEVSFPSNTIGYAVSLFGVTRLKVR